jgi:frataxin-like iron-binding protein CyaY
VIYSGNGSVTVTKEILEESIEQFQIETSGNCTIDGGIVNISYTNTTQYLLPPQLTNSSENPMLVAATLTTVTSSIKTTDIATVSFNIQEYGNVTQIILSTRTNGTETYVATATCPIVI